MASRENIIERIKKLLALASDPSAEEAAAAVLMAQRLIARYDIGDGELSGRGGDEIADAVTAEFTDGKAWRWALAELVADGFRCKYYGDSRPSWDIDGNPCTVSAFIFFGYEQDAEAAAAAFDYLYEVGDRLAEQEVRSRRADGCRTEGVYNAFACGFLDGLRGELERQGRELMLVVPAEVRNAFEEEMGGELVEGSVTMCSAHDARAQESGYEAGRAAVCGGRIDDGQSEFEL